MDRLRHSGRHGTRRSGSAPHCYVFIIAGNVAQSALRASRAQDGLHRWIKAAKAIPTARERRFSAEADHVVKVEALLASGIPGTNGAGCGLQSS